jgi:hypothetical protein
MPRGEYANTEKLAIEIVRDAELARGWTPGPLLSQRAQREEGCDLLSTPPDGGPPHRIEVKGWGEPLLADNGAFTYPADVNREQFEHAKSDPNWRLEIVGNLAAVRAGNGEPERLTLAHNEVVQRAQCWRYRIPLDGLAERVQRRPASA